MSSPDVYAVLGHPVAHSQSPFIHAEFARQTGQALVYERIDCGPDGFAAAVQALAARGGRGCNVTVPFKFEVPAMARQVSPRARLAAAANVLRLDPTGWAADNTDGVGLVQALSRHAGIDLAGKRVLLVGAGGAGAGVLGPLIEQRPQALQLVNRSVERARLLAQRHAALAAECGVPLSAGALHEAAEAFDLVINASASSLAGALSPVAPQVLAPSAHAIDLMYGPAALPFMDWARAHGAQAHDGLAMLVEQAAEAFAWWRGVRPDTVPVLAALRRRLEQR